MQQHPIPQNVTQYQFRLVGDMTLKQFLELALGLVLAYFFYASNLIIIFKWPCIILSLFLGFGLAFFPIEERPLDVWITNFLKSVYAPTRYIWKKSFRLPSFFLFQAAQYESTVTAVKTVKAPTFGKPAPIQLDLSDSELARVNAVDMLFKQAPVPTSIAPPIAEVTKPSIKVRKLNPATVIFDATGDRPVVARPGKPNIGEPKEVSIPQAPTITVDRQAKSQETNARVAAPIISAPTVKPVAKQQGVTVAAKTINLPAPPKSPNMVVGMVIDGADKMVENAIVQILNSSGIPARAIKTNSLGQFYISTPLADGDYTIEIEKSELVFPTTALKTSGDLIPPLLIKAS